MFATRLVACPPFDMAAPSDTITVLAPPLPRRRSVSVRACVGRRPPGPRPTHHTMQHMTPALPAPYAARIRSAGLCALTTRCSTLRPRSRRRTPRSRLRPWPQWRLEQELRASVFTTPTHERPIYRAGGSGCAAEEPGRAEGMVFAHVSMLHFGNGYGAPPPAPAATRAVAPGGGGTRFQSLNARRRISLPWPPPPSSAPPRAPAA